jgi:predicted nucleic acid-binding protein
MRKKIFLDTNIVIDYLSNRIPFGEDARSEERR